MKITSWNLKEIKALYLHDFTFSGFHYDYDQGKLNLNCEKPHLRKGMKLEFENVIGIHMQACGFWGGGNSILGIYPGDGHLLARYRETAQINQNFDFADLIDPENEFIEFEIEINSGGNLLVVCEALHAEEFPL